MRIKDNFRRLKQLTYILIFIIYKGWENFMDLLIGTLFLILVLIIFTLFTYKAPNGMRAMGALANAAIATFLVEAFNKYVGGEVFGIKFLEELGDAREVSEALRSRIDCACDWCVSSLRTSYWCACGGMDLLPGFFAGYLIGYVMKYTEKYVPDGVDLIGSVVLLAPLARLIAGLTPVVNNTLLKLVTLFKVVQTRIQYLWGLFSAVSLQLLVLRH